MLVLLSAGQYDYCKKKVTLFVLQILRNENGSRIDSMKIALHTPATPFAVPAGVASGLQCCVQQHSRLVFQTG